MSVSIADMEIAATSLPEISLGGDANVIEVGDLGDDFGMSLLTNTKYTRSNPQVSTAPSANTFNIASFNSPPGLQEVEVSNLEPLQSIDLNLNSEPLPSISVAKEPSFQPANLYGTNQSYANNQSSTSSGITLQPAAAPRDPAREMAEKADYINKLQRLEAKGFPVAKRFTMDNTLDEIKTEYNRLVDARQLETSIRFQRNMLMSVVTGMEWMNNKFDPFDLKLDGWSEGVHENIDDYDEIFEELYDKYKERGKMPPEARLLFQLAGSGFMCHVTNSFFRSKMPSADDIFKKNPELAKQFAAAAASQAAPGFGNFMGMAMGVPQPPTPQRGPEGVSVGGAAGPGAFFNSPQMPQHMAAAPAPQTARREMSGPSGVEDILKTFEEVRMAEEQQTNNFPQMPPSAMNNPAAVAAAEIESLASGDLGSIGTERTSGGRRRRRQAPAGNVVSLNV
jgi:hypothetical protein